MTLICRNCETRFDSFDVPAEHRDESVPKLCILCQRIYVRGTRKGFVFGIALIFILEAVIAAIGYWYAALA